MRLRRYLNEKVYDASGILVLKNGKKKKINKPISGKNLKDAKSEFYASVMREIKNGNLEDGKLIDIKVESV